MCRIADQDLTTEVWFSDSRSTSVVKFNSNWAGSEDVKVAVWLFLQLVPCHQMESQANKLHSYWPSKFRQGNYLGIGDWGELQLFHCTSWSLLLGRCVKIVLTDCLARTWMVDGIMNVASATLSQAVLCKGWLKLSCQPVKQQIVSELACVCCMLAFLWNLSAVDWVCLQVSCLDRT